jgi:outer membrane receptor protein involved in Fe transport
LITDGAEIEASYRLATGWYGFGGATYSRVGCAACGAFMTDPAATDVQYGHVPNAPAVVASAGVSSPKLGGVAHVSTELVYIGERPTRPDSDASGNLIESPTSPAWFDWNWAVYAPNVHGFDITAGVRNVIGKRDHVVAPGDYDRFDASGSSTLIPYVPGEGREVYVKVGYHY